MSDTATATLGDQVAPPAPSRSGGLLSVRNGLLLLGLVLLLIAPIFVEEFWLRTVFAACGAIIGAIGLTGVLILVAVLLGAALGGLLIGVKKFRARYNLEPIPDSEAFRIT